MQRWTKVNAPVDIGIEGIVDALSQFPQLETIESCEGGGEKGPWVCFRYGKYWENPWIELADFVLGYLAPGLVAAVGDDVSVRIQVTASAQIFGEMSVRPGAAPRVEDALRVLARDTIASRPRNSGCCGDRSDTFPARC